MKAFTEANLSITDYLQKLFNEYTNNSSGMFSSFLSPAKLNVFRAYFELKAIPKELYSFLAMLNNEHKVCGLLAGLHANNTDTIIKEHKISLSIEHNFISFTKDIAQEGCFNKKWIPFASGSDGNYFCIDYAPAENGTEGQIIAVDANQDTVYLICNSLEEFMDWLNEHYANNNIKFYAKNDNLYCNWQGGSIFDDKATFTGFEQKPAQKAKINEVPTTSFEQTAIQAWNRLSFT